MGNGQRRRTWYKQYKRRQRWQAAKPWLIGAAVAAVVVAFVLAFTPRTPTIDPALLAEEEARQSAAAENRAAERKAAEEKAASLRLETVPEGSHVLFFGDSYTVGVGADDPAKDGYAPVLADLMGWSADVAGEGGTGYVDPEGAQPPFTERAKTVTTTKTPELVILQGSSNDVNQDVKDLPKAVTSVVKTFEKRFPDAQILLIGPAPSIADDVNAVMRDWAYENGYPFIDAIAGGYLTGENFARFTSEAGGGHPTTEGYKMLAVEYAADIKALSD